MKKISKVLSVVLAVLMVLGAISITAAAADTYAIKYHANGGTGAMVNSTHEFGVEKELTANKFKRTGYTYLGWALQKSATTPDYFDKQAVVDLADEGQSLVTLYAVWAPISYAVEFDANGGEGEMANQEFKYGVTQALSENTFTREGYTFLGWAKNATSTKANYVDKKEVKNLTANDGAVITLYAVWQKNPVTVSSIFVAVEPAKKDYFVGDAFDTTGLAIGINLSDHTTQTITTGFTVSTPDMSTAGEKTVTVTYEGQTVAFTINVAEKPAEPEYNYTFSIVAPENTEIPHGESVVLSTKLEGTYPDGMYVQCTANNANFIPTLNADGSYTLVANGVGSTVFTATLYMADGTPVAVKTIELVALAEVVEPEEPDVPDEPIVPDEPEVPDEPAGGIDFLALIMSLIEMLMVYLQPIIDMVMGLIGGLA